MKYKHSFGHLPLVGSYAVDADPGFFPSKPISDAPRLANLKGSDNSNLSQDQKMGVPFLMLLIINMFQVDSQQLNRGSDKILIPT
jgi:hypothetical protein